MRISPPGIRPLSVPLGNQPFSFIGPDRVHEFRVPILSAPCDSVHIFLRLPIPNAILTRDSFRNWPGRPVLVESPTNLWAEATTPTPTTQNTKGTT